MIAVAGHHGLLMMGSPGCGKTMIARRIPSILPPLTRQQMVETTMIYSIAGKLEKGREIISAPPFRHPHHSIGKAGLLGGGSYPVPGEITMAHNGVLFTGESPISQQSGVRKSVETAEARAFSASTILDVWRELLQDQGKSKNREMRWGENERRYVRNI